LQAAARRRAVAGKDEDAARRKTGRKGGVFFRLLDYIYPRRAEKPIYPPAFTPEKNNAKAKRKIRYIQL
jgi:hypothetical protein